jgi:hypothetical protein
METKSEGHLPFLDLDIYRRPDGSLGHKVYRKHTHTNLYLIVNSHHHPSNKQAVLSTLIHRARALCVKDSLQAELVFLRDVLKQNGYNDRQINRALNRLPHLDQPDNKPNSIAFLSLVGPVFNRSWPDTSNNSTILPSSPRKPDIWIPLLGKSFRLNTTLTISTESVVFV